MKDHKYKTIFSSEIKALVSEDKDKYLSMASLKEISEFLPDIDTDKEIDLLPVAFNACVANRVNKNGDVIDAATAVEMYKSFINKQINIEHNRERVIGCILTAGFSEFGSDVPLTEEEVKEKKEPFNITLGGIIWKVASSTIANLIEESADPTSEHYMKISASWELGFSDYHIVAIESGSKNIEDGVTFTEESEIDKMKEELRAFGGDGKLKDGTHIYRKVVENVVPLGIGLTESPAADVKGIATEEREHVELVLEEKTKEKQALDRKNKILKNIENNSSQTNEKNVKDDKEITVIMKIESIKDITDEALTELKASHISDFIQEEIKKASLKYEDEKSHVENALKAAEEKYEQLLEEQTKTQAELKEAGETMEKVQSSLNSLEEEKTEREAQERFNQRMSSLDEEYELNDGDREVIANDIKDFDDEQYEHYSKKLSVLLKDKSKASVEEKKKEEVKAQEEAESQQEAKASEETEEVVSEAVENADEEEEAIANSMDAEADSLYEKYRQAFSVENFDIDTKL